MSRLKKWDMEKQSLTTEGKKEILSDCKVGILLEQEDLTLASRYSSNLVLYAQLKPECIEIWTSNKVPKSFTQFNILIFDICKANSENITLIEEINFEGNIIVFAPADLPQTVIANISNQVTEVLVKPIDWSSLRNKEYFR